nr:MAG TPA: hypothetical protein [Caudoviricetes sp.]
MGSFCYKILTLHRYPIKPKYFFDHPYPLYT